MIKCNLMELIETNNNFGRFTEDMEGAVTIVKNWNYYTKRSKFLKIVNSIIDVVIFGKSV